MDAQYTNLHALAWLQLIRTLIPPSHAVQLPVATFQSGPVNSLRGTALLTGVQHAAVIDIGGTTTDVGLLVDGLPRPAPRVTLLAGAPTNFQARLTAV